MLPGDPEWRLVMKRVLKLEADRLVATPRWRQALLDANLALLGDHEAADDTRVTAMTALMRLFPQARDEEILAMLKVIIPIDEAGRVTPSLRPAGKARPRLGRQ